MLEHKLYRMGFFIPLLKCIKNPQSPRYYEKYTKGLTPSTWVVSPWRGKLYERRSEERRVGKEHKWTIFVDGASSSPGSGAGILLENEEGVVIEHLLTLSFLTSNN